MNTKKLFFLTYCAITLACYADVPLPRRTRQTQRRPIISITQLIATESIPAPFTNAEHELTLNLSNRRIQSINGIEQLQNYARNNFNTSFEGIDLTDNNIRNLENNTFAGQELEHITFLFLGSNPLQITHRNSFLGLNNIRLLDLSETRITRFEPGTFTVLPRLETLLLPATILLEERNRIQQEINSTPREKAVTIEYD